VSDDCTRVEGHGCGWFTGGTTTSTCRRLDSVPGDTADTGDGYVVGGGICGVTGEPGLTAVLVIAVVFMRRKHGGTETRRHGGS
jgi:hypothetical protein